MVLQKAGASSPNLNHVIIIVSIMKMVPNSKVDIIIIFHNNNLSNDIV